MSRPRAFRALAILALAISAGCASGGTTTGGADPAISPATVPAEGSIVQIYNTASSSVRVTVYMVPEVGVDTPLGTVEAGQRTAFPFEGPPGRYRLRAVGSNGSVQSQLFEFYRNSQVRWDMNLNHVGVGGRRPPDPSIHRAGRATFPARPCPDPCADGGLPGGVPVGHGADVH
jgi:hypothetical protein